MNEARNRSEISQNKQQTLDSKYIQQHLANERTYLAWIRTSITIMGVGFLITNLHFTTSSIQNIMGDILAKIIGLASIIVGVAALIMTTISYFIKGNEINDQTFKFSRLMVVYLSVSLILIFLVFGLYYLYVWGVI
jgi:putative membrane protein